MVEPSELIELASWSEDPTTMGALATALGQVWQEAGQQVPPAAGARPAATGGILRTRVVNFVAYADSEGVRERVSGVLKRISGTHPSRSMLVLSEASSGSPSLAASLQAYCRAAPEADHRLCFDQIFLNARGPVTERLPGIVTRLLIPDLPSLLWWPGDPPLESPPFARIAAVCDVVIVDSSEFVVPLAGLRSLARLARASRRRQAFADLNWDRLTEWREIVAQFFDVPSLRSHLQHIQNVEITFVADQRRRGRSAQALLFAGWLASRLGWNPIGTADESIARFQSGVRTTEVRFEQSTDGNAEPGSLVSVRLQSNLQGQTSRFSVSITDDEGIGKTELQLGESGPIVRHFSLGRKSEHRLISEEIEAVGADCALEDALKAVDVASAPASP